MTDPSSLSASTPEQEHIAALNAALAEHAEFGGLFQPGGRFYKEAQLPLGRSAVVEGGRWLVQRLDDLLAENASLRDNNAKVKAMFDERALAASPSPPVTQELPALVERWRKECVDFGGPCGDGNFDDDYYKGFADCADQLEAALAPPAPPVTCEWRELPMSEAVQPDCMGDNFDVAMLPADIPTAWEHCPYCGRYLSLSSDGTPKDQA